VDEVGIGCSIGECLQTRLDLVDITTSEGLRDQRHRPDVTGAYMKTELVPICGPPTPDAAVPLK
jgi:hypothetical protein